MRTNKRWGFFIAAVAMMSAGWACTAPLRGFEDCCQTTTPTRAVATPTITHTPIFYPTRTPQPPPTLLPRPRTTDVASNLPVILWAKQPYFHSGRIFQILPPSGWEIREGINSVEVEESTHAARANLQFIVTGQDLSPTQVRTFGQNAWQALGIPVSRPQRTVKGWQFTARWQQGEITKNALATIWQEGQTLWLSSYQWDGEATHLPVLLHKQWELLADPANLLPPYQTSYHYQAAAWEAELPLGWGIETNRDGSVRIPDPLGVGALLVMQQPSQDSLEEQMVAAVEAQGLAVVEQELQPDGSLRFTLSSEDGSLVGEMFGALQKGKFWLFGFSSPSDSEWFFQEPFQNMVLSFAVR